MTITRHGHNPLTGPLVAWEDDFSDEQFIADLVRQARQYARPNGPVLILGNAEITDAVGAALTAAGLHTIRPPERQAAAVAIADPDPRAIHTEWQRVAKDPELRTVPVIYRPRARGSYPLLTRHDDLIARGLASDRHHYITSAFDSGVEEQVYAWTLERVPPKCAGRDAYDLFQCLHNIESVEGTLIEFGAYQGHSGLLTAEYLRRQDCPREIYLLDAFEEFPVEQLGIDTGWSRTHQVDYNSVLDRFADFPNVHLLQGDFAHTVDRIPDTTKVAFALVDCDTLRGTAFALDWLQPRLVRGAVVMCEDYGHHQLLGARMAVDEFISRHPRTFTTFFSFASGAQILIRR